MGVLQYNCLQFDFINIYYSPNPFRLNMHSSGSCDLYFDLMANTKLTPKFLFFQRKLKVANADANQLLYIYKLKEND